MPDRQSVTCWITCNCRKGTTGAVAGVDFKNLEVVLKEASTLATGEAVPAVAIRYGLFLNTVTDFLIVAFTIFLMVRSINRLAKLRAAPAA